jgi:creatinine amidohydrolase/Fe(II)-dependent formamide hydrolase-like protein
MPFGTDPLNAENVALKVCAKTGGLVWPTQFWGTERERPESHLASLGFKKGQYIVGMDFPNNILKSMYCPEEVFAVVLRELLDEAVKLGAKLAVLVNGHGGENHMRVLDRLAAEYNGRRELAVMVRIAAPKTMLSAGSGGHADAGETSVMMHVHPDCVDLKALPPKSRKIKYKDFAVVDGPGFDGKGPSVHFTLGKADDPRVSASAARGKKGVDRTISEVAWEVSQALKAIGRK